MKLVAYLRVSTRRQGDSGLGLDAQRAAVKSHAKAVGAKVIAWYTEVESGRRPDRPELVRAIGHATLAGATLVVAKLDRLTRNAAFLHRLLESKLPFVACDNPHATKLTVQILAAIAEWEADAISSRVTAALAAYRDRGGVLGADDPRCPGLKVNAAARQLGVAASVRAHQRKAAEHRAVLLPVVRELRAAGQSLAWVAIVLNRRGYRTRRGLPWSKAKLVAYLNWSPPTA